MVELSIVLSTLGNHEVLGLVLDGYERQDAPPGSFELIVVADRDEPEPDAVVRAIDGRPYPVRLLRGEVPGLSANRNTGWHAARAPLVMFTDNDTIPAKRLVSEHLASHRRWRAQEDAVLGLVRWAPDINVSPFMKWLEYGLQFQYESIRGQDASWAHLYGANASIKRALLERVGGYDEQHLPYGYEDIDWGYRAHRHGLRVRFNSQAVVEHYRTMTVADWQARAQRLAVSEWRFCQLHPEIAPFFQQMFSQAARSPSYGRRAAAISRFVPRRTPWVGRQVWDRAGHHWRQQIAPFFLAAWDAAEAGDAPELQPAVSALAERAANPGGSRPGGPK
jgi:GT2 family glycosyltransferase